MCARKRIPTGVSQSVCARACVQTSLLLIQEERQCSRLFSCEKKRIEGDLAFQGAWVSAGGVVPAVSERVGWSTREKLRTEGDDSVSGSDASGNASGENVRHMGREGQGGQMMPSRSKREKSWRRLAKERFGNSGGAHTTRSTAICTWHRASVSLAPFPYCSTLTLFHPLIAPPAHARTSKSAGSPR